MSENGEHPKRERKDLTGELYQNDFKKPGDNLPSMRGFVKIDGKEYRATAWTRYSQRDGKKFLSLSFQSRETWEREVEAAKAKKASMTATPAENSEAADGNLPF